MLSSHGRLAWISFLSIILVVSIIPVTSGSQSSHYISSIGSIGSWPSVNITVNASKVTGVSNLSLGFQLDWHRWKTFMDSPTQRQLAQDAGFKLVRVFDFRPSAGGVPRLMPCTYWNESTKTGTWNWAYIDSLVQRIFEMGAEPLFSLGWARENIQNYIPSGMVVNPGAGLPYPDSWAAYCKEWVKHFKQTGQSVRFYETMNEPWMYFGWDDYTKISNFMAMFNAAAEAMRAENPNVLLGFDGTNRKVVLDYWLANGGADLGFISFHKYDAWTIGQYSDGVMLNRAETFQMETSSSYYGVQDARQVYYNARGKWIPVINSESNFNSAWETGTDPKVQHMVGSVWLALVLRMGILEGLNHNIYFEFSSSKSWDLVNRQSGGWGLGMTNEDDSQPWYPYYVHNMIGSNLAVGDNLVETKSSSNDVRSITWINDGKLIVLLVCKVNEKRVVALEGINEQFNVNWIDSTITYENPSLQTSIIDSTQPFIMSGYTVMLLQSF